MIKREPYEIKLEEDRENELRFGMMRKRQGVLKIEYDPVLYPPIKWTPLKLVPLTTEKSQGDNISQQNSSGSWVKTMKKILNRLLRSYLDSIQKQNLQTKFKRWRHSSTFIFAILMYVTHNIPHSKNAFCDSYQLKIQNLESDKYDESDIMQLRDSVRIVLEFIIGEPGIAIEEFYRKYRSELSFDGLKAKKFLKIVERAIVDLESHRQIQLEFISGEMYQEHDQEMPKVTQRKSARLMHNRESDDNPHSSQPKSAKLEGYQEILIIYRKDDPLKKPLYPMDTNYIIKDALNDLFPS